MKRFFLAALLFGAMVFSVAAAGPVVTVVNNTGYTIYYLFFSESADEMWGEDVLDEEVLVDGDSFQITLPSAGTWDFGAEDEDGDSYAQYNQNIKRNTTITFTLDDLE
ncbi:hypothetical protein FACS1894172_11510 [Spirochaetia bacterium]|nr:hypothetical protein FACS1894172_11510 [Spirochaetia bacterium]